MRFGPRFGATDLPLGHLLRGHPPSGDSAGWKGWKDINKIGCFLEGFQSCRNLVFHKSLVISALGFWANPGRPKGKAEMDPAVRFFSFAEFLSRGSRQTAADNDVIRCYKNG